MLLKRNWGTTFICTSFDKVVRQRFLWKVIVHGRRHPAGVAATVLNRTYRGGTNVFRLVKRSLSLDRASVPLQFLAMTWMKVQLLQSWSLVRCERHLGGYRREIGK